MLLVASSFRSLEGAFPPNLLVPSVSKHLVKVILVINLPSNLSLVTDKVAVLFSGLTNKSKVK